MNSISRFAMPFAFAAVLALGACSGEANIDVNADSTLVDDTTADLAPDANDVNDTVGPDVNLDSAGAAVGDAANGAQNEATEKMVEAQLMVAPGFSEVDVESEGDGVMILTGTVATEAEKMDAEAETKKIAGVKSVKNNITIK